MKNLLLSACSGLNLRFPLPARADLEQEERETEELVAEQAPRKVFVLTTTETSVPRARGTKAKKVQSGYPIGETAYQFIQVKPERFFGAEKAWFGEARVAITVPGFF